VDISCIEKSGKSENSNFGLRFLRFFEMPLQKNVKSRVFLFSEKRKIRILELWLSDSPQSDGDGEYDELVDAADSLDVGDLEEGRNPLAPGPVTSR